MTNFFFAINRLGSPTILGTFTIKVGGLFLSTFKELKNLRIVKDDPV